MPTPYSWLLLGAGVPLPFAAAVYPTFPTGPGPGGMCDGVFHDQEYFIDLFDRIFPQSYLGPLKANTNSGYEFYLGVAKMHERVSAAIERLECGSLIMFADEAAKATGVVEFYRLAGGPEVTVRQGTIVMTSRAGRQFVTTEDATFALGDNGPHVVAIEAVLPGYEWNVPGQLISAFGETIPGDIDTIFNLIEEPAYEDPNILVRQLDATTGGKAPMLEGLGTDRGIIRQPGEEAIAYRYRVRSLPDTVSPGAIRRTLTALLSPLEISFEIVETWDIRYQTAYDAPGAPIAGSPDYDPNLFAYDDPRPPPAYTSGLTFCDRYLDDVDYRGAFFVVLPYIPTINDVGMAFDDTAMDQTQHLSPAPIGGPRGYAAFDVPITFAYLNQGGYDGFDLPKDALYASVWRILQEIKAAGVAAVTVRA